MAKKNVVIEAEAVEIAEEVQTVPAIIKADKSEIFLLDDKAINTEVLTAKKDEYLLLEINGIEDKAGYDAVKKANADLRTTRTTLENVRKEKVKPVLAWLADVKETVDSLGEICKAGELAMKAKMEVIDNEKAEIKRKKEEEAQRILQTRVADLFRFGAGFDGVTYTFPYATDISTTSVDLKDMSDELYSAFISGVESEYKLEEFRQAEKLRQEEEDKANIMEVAESNKATSQVLSLKATRLRLKELTLMGFVAVEGEEDTFHNSDIGTHEIKINQGDDEWDELMLLLQDEIDKANKPVAETVSEFTPEFEDGVEKVLDYTDEQPAVTMTDDSVEVISLHFTDTSPFIDVNMKSFIFRLFPDKYEAEARATQTIASEGIVAHELNYILIKG